MRRSFALTLSILALGLAACSAEESSLSADQLGVAQTLDDSASAWIDDDPEAGGAVADATPAPAPTPLAGLDLAPGDTFHHPAFWGRFRRAHRPSRDRLIVVEGDTARVSLAVTFNGLLLVDTTLDGILDPGTKPLHERATQSLLLVRDSTTAHGWRLAGLTVRRFQNADPAKRTVQITSVSVQRNSDAASTLSDPEAFLTPEALTSVSVGDTLRVTVQVSNSTGTGLVPPTQMFIHVRHLQPGIDAWARFPMTRVDDTTFTAHWVVRRSGRALIGIDALDSETLATETGDDYRSELWGVPVRVQ